MFSFLSADEEGLKKNEFSAYAKREPFSKWLPYIAYEKENQRYINNDDSTGYLWECCPLAFLAEKSADSIAGVLQQRYPEETTISFTLYPDDYISPTLDRFVKLKTKDNAVTQEAAKRYADYLRGGATGLGSLGGTPVRNFRLIVALKSPHKISDESLAQVKEGLAAAGLSPVAMQPEKLLAFLRRIFNRPTPENAESYDPDRYLRNQIISAEHPVVSKNGTLFLGNTAAACLTPKTLTAFDPLDINELIGGFRGRSDDNTQIANRFIWTTTVMFRTDAAAIKKKASIMMAQKAGGSIAKELNRRVEELSWVLDDIESKEYCDVITSFWVLGDDEDHLSEGLARARSLWENHNFVMQKEDRIAVPLFIASLPFGLITGGPKYPNVETLDRDFPISVGTAARMLPIQADYAGHMEPVISLVGRKGQLVSVDVFDPSSNNNNFLICAGSGAGKSFFNNFLVSNYYATGALIRLVDIGYSYQKQCLINKGRFIDIAADTKDLVLNPFSTTKTNDSEDAAKNRATVAQILLAMVYSGTGVSRITETHLTLVKQGVDFAYERDGGEYGIDHVCEFLKVYPKLAKEGEGLERVAGLAHEMAFNLSDWVSKGRYGAMFNGKSTFDISNDEFVVLEMEQLLGDPELFSVVSLQVLNAITQDLYLSDRSQKRFILFDEAWKYLVTSDGDKGSMSAISAIIEEAYRRARKYQGSTGIVTQSPLDLGSMGLAGQVIKSNSAFKFWLENDAEDWEAARKRDIVSYSGLAHELAVSVRSHKPHYSEIFVDSPFGAGVARLSVDPWTKWVNTSDPKEFHTFATTLKKFNGDAMAALNFLADS